MLGLFRKVSQRLLERGVGAVAWIAPIAAILVSELFVRGAEQGAVPFPRERLPVQIISRRSPSHARAFAAAMLMHDHATKRLDAFWNPNCISHRHGQLTWLARGLVTDRVIGRLFGGEGTGQASEKVEDGLHVISLGSPGPRRVGSGRHGFIANSMFPEILVSVNGMGMG